MPATIESLGHSDARFNGFSAAADAEDDPVMALLEYLSSPGDDPMPAVRRTSGQMVSLIVEHARPLAH